MRIANKLWAKCLFLSLLVFCTPAFGKSDAVPFKFFNLQGKPATAVDCATLLMPQPVGTTKVQDEDEIIFTAWNVENVMDMAGAFDMAGVDPATGKYRFEKAKDREDRGMEKWKFPHKQKKIAEVGQYLGKPGVLSHFIVSPEIESINAANRLFNSGILAGKYRPFLIEGNDGRSIDIGFAVRADLDVIIEMETHREVMWRDPANGQIARLFSRDFPVMIVRDRASGRVLCLIFGNHGKSKRDRPGDDESTTLRSAQYWAEEMIIDVYKARFKGIPTFAMGDYNTDVQTSKEVEPVRRVLKDAFDVKSPGKRETQTYYPPKGAMVASQLDAIYVSPEVEPHIIKTMVLPEFDHLTGQLLSQVPRSYKERTTLYSSDHRAIAIVVRGDAFR